MHKNKFCSIPIKSKYDAIITKSQSTLYQKKGDENNKNKNIRKLKESFYNKDFKPQNISYLSKENNEPQYMKYYIISQNNLKKYTSYKMVNIGMININNVIFNNKCHYTAIYNEIVFSNNTIDYIKKFYKYNESIKIIPKREVYFRHLMQFLERPVFRNFINNKIIKQIGLDKLSIYRRTNYPKKFNKNIDLNSNICYNNIIFNSNVIETIENCSTSTQCSNRNNNNLTKKNKINNQLEIKENNNENEASIISEIKINNCQNKKNDNNYFCIDNSLLMLMKDLSISQNKINSYLCQNNLNYKNLYNKIKNKSKKYTITNKNYLDKKYKIDNKESKQIKDNEYNSLQKKMTQTKKLNNINFYKKLTNTQSNNNVAKYNTYNDIIDNEICHNSISSHKKINNIKIIPFNSNNLNSQINTKNSCCNTNKCCLSSVMKNKPLIIQNLKKKIDTNSKIYNKDNHDLHRFFNLNLSKDKNNDLNLINFLNNNKIIYNLNNKEILKKINKIVRIKEPKNKSMKKYTKTKKLLTESSICMLDLNSLNENGAKKKYQTINAVKSISISNNQFFNQKSECKKIDYK